MAGGSRMASLAEAVAARVEVERCPCTGCLLADRCRDQQVACRHFYLYVNPPGKGRARIPKEGLRSPTARIFAKLFSGLDEEFA